MRHGNPNGRKTPVRQVDHAEQRIGRILGHGTHQQVRAVRVGPPPLRSGASIQFEPRDGFHRCIYYGVASPAADDEALAEAGTPPEQFVCVVRPGRPRVGALDHEGQGRQRPTCTTVRSSGRTTPGSRRTRSTRTGCRAKGGWERPTSTPRRSPSRRRGRTGRRRGRARVPSRYLARSTRARGPRGRSRSPGSRAATCPPGSPSPALEPRSPVAPRRPSSTARGTARRAVSASVQASAWASRLGSR